MSSFSPVYTSICFCHGVFCEQQKWSQLASWVFNIVVLLFIFIASFNLSVFVSLTGFCFLTKLLR